MGDQKSGMRVFAYNDDVVLPASVTQFALDGIYQEGDQLWFFVIEKTDTNIVWFIHNILPRVLDESDVVYCFAPTGWVDDLLSDVKEKLGWDYKTFDFRDEDLKPLRSYLPDQQINGMGFEVFQRTKGKKTMEPSKEIIQAYGFKATIKLSPVVGAALQSLDRFKKVLAATGSSGILLRPPDVPVPITTNFDVVAEAFEHADAAATDKKIASMWARYFEGLEYFAASLGMPAYDHENRAQQLDLALENFSGAQEILGEVRGAPQYLKLLFRIYSAWVAYIRLVRVDHYVNEQFELLAPVLDSARFLPLPLLTRIVEDKEIVEGIADNANIEALNLLGIVPAVTELWQGLRYHLHSEKCQIEIQKATVRQRSGTDEQSLWKKEAQTQLQLAEVIAEESGKYSYRYTEELGSHLNRLKRLLDDFEKAGSPPLLVPSSIQFCMPFIYDRMPSSTETINMSVPPFENKRMVAKLALEPSFTISIHNEMFDNAYWQAPLDLDASVLFFEGNTGVIFFEANIEQISSPISLRDLVTIGMIFENSGTYFRVTSSLNPAENYASLAQYVQEELSSFFGVSLVLNSQSSTIAFLEVLPSGYTEEKLYQILQHLGLVGFRTMIRGTQMISVEEGKVMSSGNNVLLSPRATMTLAYTEDNEAFKYLFYLATALGFRLQNIQNQIDSGEYGSTRNKLTELKLDVRNLRGQSSPYTAEVEHFITLLELDTLPDELIALL